MGEAEQRLISSGPIREDILRLQNELVTDMKLGKLSWERGIATTHLRSCLQCLLMLLSNHNDVKTTVEGK